MAGAEAGVRMGLRLGLGGSRGLGQALRLGALAGSRGLGLGLCSKVG